MNYNSHYIIAIKYCVSLIYLITNIGLSNAQENLDQRHVHSLQILDEIQNDISISDAARNKLAAQITEIDLERQTINEQLIEASTKARKLELRIERVVSQYSKLDDQYVKLNSSLTAKDGLMAEILAALLRMGRNPPPALLVSPKDALKSVRSAILLGSVVPEIRSQTDILLAELRELAKIKGEKKSNRNQLTQLLQSGAVQENRLSLLIQEKKKLSRSTRAKLARNEVAAAKLAARASSIESLINQLEVEIDVVKIAAKKASETDKLRHSREQLQISKTRKEIASSDFTDNSRITPAIDFDKAKNKLPKPVSGVLVQKFGDIDGIGDKSKSVAIATRVNARVISPSDGWVVYSGPFKAYGQLLILNAGTKHHIILSGMEKINVELGQFVLLGEPVGIMGTRRIASAQTIDIGLTRPVLNIEFRRDGESIDPALWWREETKTKVEQ